jgi:hypothetical protein
MFHAIPPLTPDRSTIDRRSLDNPAVAYCFVASERAYRTGLKETKSRMLARKHSREAFRQALPTLSGLDNIGNFIACIAFAISKGVFVDGDDADLLSDAQIALKSLAAELSKERPGGKSAESFPSPRWRR